MAPAAIRPNSLVMHIGVATIAGCFGFRENQRRMTCTAICGHVLAIQWKSSFIVIESVDRFIQLPAVSTVTQITAQVKILAMRGI